MDIKETFMGKLTDAYEHPLIEDCSNETVAFIIALYFAMYEMTEESELTPVGDAFDTIVNEIDVIIDEFSKDDDEQFMQDVLTNAEIYESIFNMIGTDCNVKELRSASEEEIKKRAQA